LVGYPTPAGQDSLVQKIYFPLPGTQTAYIRDNITGQAKTLRLSVYGSFEFAVMPNPATSSADFLFNLTSRSSAEISIFNAAGDKIRRIDLGAADAMVGINRLHWDGLNSSSRPIASGIYLALLRTDSGGSMIKFAYIK
jgi:hypothetical protein